MLRLRTVCLVAVALAAGGFFVGRMLVAQDNADRANRRGGPRAGGGFGLGKLDLLKIKDVQKNLELTDEQKATIEKFADEMHTQMQAELKGIRDLSPEERRAKYTEMRSKLDEREKEVQKKLDEVLKTPQRDRLGQIELQAQMKSGRLEVFSKKEVAEGLGLTDDQKEKLKDLREKARSEAREGRGPGGQGGPPSEEDRAKRKKLQEENMAKAKDILTPEQREKLEKMAGKPVDFDLSQIGGFGGRGRRGRPGAGGPTDKPADKTPEKSADKPAEKTDTAAPSK